MGGIPLAAQAEDHGIKLAALLDRAEREGNRAQHHAVAEIVRDYDRYAPHIERLVDGATLSSYKEFVVTLAIRTHQRDTPTALTPGLEEWLLFRTATGDTAVRFNARMILRAGATAATIDRFLAAKVRIRRQAGRVGVRDGQRMRHHYAQAGADVLYDFALASLAAVRRGTDRRTRRQSRQVLDDALRALSVAWAQHASVAPRHRIDFVKALYGKGLAWIAAAEQIARDRLPRPVTLAGETGLSTASALGKASALFHEFDRETQPTTWRN